MPSSQATLNLKRTPLHNLVAEQKARFTEFAGWEMAVQYSGLKQEHEAVRTSVGMFDISHMGKFALQGKRIREHLQLLVPSDLERLKSGQAQYTLLLNTQGGIIDDIIFYYLGEDEAGLQKGMIIVNAATKTKDKAWLLANLEAAPVKLEDISSDKVLLALQGPQAIEIIQPYIKEDISALKSFEHREATLLSQHSFIARTGYTGEDGLEIMVAPDVGKELWRLLLNGGVTPCGLGARDTLRLEAALSLYGQDIDETTTPLEAGLGWLVHWERQSSFVGRPILEKQKAEGVTRRLVGLEMEGRHIARHGYSVLFEGNVVGEITSGTLAPTVKRAIALAYVPKKLAKVGQKLDVEIRNKSYPAVVVKKPFYRSPHR